jgi:hypothetical protein
MSHNGCLNILLFLYIIVLLVRVYFCEFNKSKFECSFDVSDLKWKENRDSIERSIDQVRNME